MIDFSTAIDFLSTLAVLTLLSNSYGWFKRSIGDARRVQWCLGALFGCVALLMMNMTLAIGEGLVIDLRVIPVILAGAFLGWRGAAVCMAIAVAMRLSIGGAGALAGCAAVVVAGTVGLAWARFTSDSGTRGVRALLMLGVLGSCTAFTAVLLPPGVGLWFVRTLSPWLAAAYILLIPFYAALMQREDHAIRSERLLRKSATTDPSTGLMTPEAFERAAAHVAAADADTRGTGLVLVRLRHARWIREVYGEVALNTVIGALRVRMEDRLHSGDLIAVGPVNGLAVLSPDIDADRLAILTERVAREVGTRPVRLESGDELRVSLDVGATWEVAHRPLAEMMEAASRDMDRRTREADAEWGRATGREGLRGTLFDRAGKRMTAAR